MSKTNKFKPNQEIVIYLKQLGYKLPEGDFEKHLNSHPKFPSVTAIKETLSGFKIEYIVLEADFKLLQKLPDTFIAVVKNDDFEIIYKNSSNFELMAIDLNKPIVKSKEFQSQWSEFIIIVESSSRDNRMINGNQLIWFTLSIIIMIIFATYIIFFS